MFRRRNQRGQTLTARPLLIAGAAALSLAFVGISGATNPGGQNASGTTTTVATTTTTAPATTTTVALSGCNNARACWPGPTNTGYQNAPGYTGTLTAAGGSGCPTTVVSNSTIQFCNYTGLDVGLPASPVSHVHFIGDLFRGSGYSATGSATVKVHCTLDCTFDYVTVRPATCWDTSGNVISQNPCANVNPPAAGVSSANGFRGPAFGVGMGEYSTSAIDTHIRHADIWGMGGGLYTGGTRTAATPLEFSDSYMHDFSDDDSCNPGNAYHEDGVAMADTNNSTSDVVINHNYMAVTFNRSSSASPCDPYPGSSNTAADAKANTNDIAFQQGTYNRLTITNNYFAGFAYTIAIWSTASNVIFTGNVITNEFFVRYGIDYGQLLDNWSACGGTCQWSNNHFLAVPNPETNPWLYNPTNNTNSLGPTDSGKCWLPGQTFSATQDYGGGSCPALH